MYWNICMWNKAITLDMTEINFEIVPFAGEFNGVKFIRTKEVCVYQSYDDMI